jgi:acetylornithine/N-succinyldiaminopimelate aminotransferase
MKMGTHGSTFGGNPLAMAVGNAVFDELTKPGFMDEVNEVAGYLKQQLHGLADTYPDVIEEVRGRGLLIGMKLKDAVVNRDFVGLARDNGLLIGAAGDNVARMAPPLTVTKDDVRTALEKLEVALKAATDKLKG